MGRCPTCGTPVAGTDATCERCIFDPDGEHPWPDTDTGIDSHAGSVEFGAWTSTTFTQRVAAAIAVAVVLLAGAAVWTGQDGSTPAPDEAQGSVAEPLSAESDESTESDDFPGVAPDGRGRAAAAFPTRLWDGPELLVAFNSESELVVFDLDSGRRSTWRPPDPLLNESPLTIWNSIIVVTESGAYERATGTNSSWNPLGEANRVRASTKADRLWLRTPVTKVTGLEADFLWTEVDLNGVEHRSMNRTDQLDFPTPELVWGLNGAIFRFDDQPIPQWRILSDFARPVAVGTNQVVSRECTSSFECGRVWYDTSSGLSKGPLFADLARNIEVDYDALVSDDGRFVVSEAPGGRAEIYSIVTGDRLANNCVWGSPIEWTSESELLACRSSSGVEVYDANLGVSLGLALTAGEFEPFFVFVDVVGNGARSGPRTQSAVITSQ